MKKRTARWSGIAVPVVLTALAVAGAAGRFEGGTNERDAAQDRNIERLHEDLKALHEKVNAKLDALAADMARVREDVAEIRGRIGK